MPANLVWSLFWLVQVNLLAWLVAAIATGFERLPILIGLAFGTALEHVHVRRIHPRLRALSAEWHHRRTSIPASSGVREPQAESR